jgi:adenylate cyclase
MADLSGYTALTETHGAVSAADIIDKYISIAEDCMVADTRIHERTGDEIMFVADCPDSLLATALKLEALSASQDHFLMVHGGLHWGKVLKRNGHYFGAAINMASRIAAKAAPGSFSCSKDFVSSVKDTSVCKFMSQGAHAFKNITGKIEVFEVGTGTTMTSYIDPVCRMRVVNIQKAIPHPTDDRLYFCSSQCLKLHGENSGVV